MERAHNRGGISIETSDKRWWKASIEGRGKAITQMRIREARKGVKQQGGWPRRAPHTARMRRGGRVGSFVGDNGLSK